MLETDSFNVFSPFNVGISCFVSFPLIALIRFQYVFLIGRFVPNLLIKPCQSLSLVDLFSSRIIFVNLLYNFFVVTQ